MTENLIIANELIIISLLLVAIIASMTLRYLRMPYTIGLVIIGYAFSAFVVPHITILEPLDQFFPAVDIILYIFLPPLIFESAIALNTRLLSRNLFPVLGLAIFGVIISAGIIGYLISWYFAIPLLFALLFGALISSTDPVAVISIFKEIGVPKRLQILLEGESLLNDAASIIMFQLVLLLISHPLIKDNLTFLDTSSLFLTNLLISLSGGIVIGIFGGVLLRWILRRTPLHGHIHQTATLVAAYLTYLIGDELGFSGVIAVVICGFSAARTSSDWIGPEKREELTHFWDYIGFLANSLIFLLVGITIASLNDISVFMKGGVLGVVFIIGVVLIARFIPVFGVFGLYNLFTSHKVPVSYQTVCFWGGLRGAVAIALFLSIPSSLPFRDLIIAFSVTIVIFTIFVQGLTMGPFIRILKLGQSTLLRHFHDMYTDLIVSRGAYSSLRSSYISEIITPEILDQHKQKLTDLTRDKEIKIREFWDQIHQNPDRMSVIRLFWLEALRYEQKQYRHLYDNALLLPKVYAELQYHTSIREDLIQSGNYHPVVTLYAPGSRFRLWFREITARYIPESPLKRWLDETIEIHKIFAATAIIIATSATTRYLERLSQWVFLDPAEINDIFEVYNQLQGDALRYIRSENIAGSCALHDIWEYLAERTEGAGMIAILHHHLEEGVGDEKIVLQHISQLLKERNSARKRVIRSYFDEFFP